MQEKIEAFIHLSDLFKANNHQLLLVGGTVRDFLLHLELSDMDVVTDATPEEMKTFLPDCNMEFSKYGFVKCRFNEIKFDITTFRKEKEYRDNRHPSKIIFVKSPRYDYVRRDFTINGLYADERFNIIDYCGGQKDINNRVLRTIGNPKKRIIEDPLRILRAIRFSLMYNFIIDEELQRIMKKYNYLIDELNKDKINEEIRKIKNVDRNIQHNIFAEYGLLKYLEGVK